MSPLEIRGWVMKLPPEEIHAEILHRIDALENGVKSYRDIFVRAGRLLTESALRRIGRPGPLPDLPAEAEDIAARGGAASIVATYWAEHEYRPGVFLPPVMSHGLPWDTFPDAIHVLDLDAGHIRTSLKHVPELKQLDAVTLERISKQPHDALFLLGAALRMVRARGPLAAFDGLVQVTLFIWLWSAHYAPTRKAAEFAADCAAELLDAFKPDLSRHMTRTPERLDELQRVFTETVEKVKRINHELRSEGLTKRVLALARNQIGPRIGRHDISRWQRMDTRTVATESLARERRISVKSLKEQLRLAEKAQAIDEAWDEFLVHLRTRPMAEQQRIQTALPPLFSPAAQPAPTAKK